MSIDFHIEFPDLKAKGMNVKEILEVKSIDDFHKMDFFIDKHKGSKIFCALSYDLKEFLHDLPSHNVALSDFPKALFVAFSDADFSEFEIIKDGKASETSKFEFPLIESYENQCRKIKNHLKLGDIYETNYCIAPKLTSEIDPIKTYQQLKENNKAPFSAFLRYKNNYLLCSSPERFIKKTGNRLISQPIKGTIKRGKNQKEDDQLKNQLANDPKETAENIMIVDLVRNDLSQIALRNSVKVDHLNQVQTFETVHQLVSTISCELRNDVGFTDILKATFPMGSMTGAPKRRAMELMEEYEDFKRGLYSGAIGYIDENGDFDFNVVIRSILYNADEKQVAFPVGSAITYKSVCDMEYQECRLKANSMIQALKNAE